MIETILILLTTQFLAMMSPGPDMFLILKNTLGQPNKKAAVSTILGIGLGLSVHISVSIAGLGILLVQSTFVYSTIRYAGAAYLAYIGLKSLLLHSRFKVGSFSSKLAKPAGEAFREGLLTNLLNPKVTLFILSLFTQMIAPTLPLSQKLTYAIVLVVEAIVVWTVFAFVVKLPVISKRLERFSIWIDRLFGFILLCIAASVFLTSW